jgi:hypothetical protein
MNVSVRLPDVSAAPAPTKKVKGLTHFSSRDSVTRYYYIRGELDEAHPRAPPHSPACSTQRIKKDL